MKKPLRNDEEVFFSLVEGKLSALGSGEAWVVVQAANQSLKRGSSGGIIVLDEILAFEDCVLGWLERIANKEPIGLLTDDLNERIRGIPFIHLINPDEQGQPRWEHIAVLDPGTPTQIKAAHAVSLFLASGGFKKLRRCKADGCQMFFLGPSNRKWCSHNCGSRMRGRRLRKRRWQHRYAL
jgi:predicted RNA-binding Zn ribbon-like protein